MFRPYARARKRIHSEHLTAHPGRFQLFGFSITKFPVDNVDRGLPLQYKRKIPDHSIDHPAIVYSGIRFMAIRTVVIMCSAIESP